MIKVIKGGIHEDNRGMLTYFNQFNMTPVKRMYSVKFASTDDIRAWIGHKKEQKWYYCDQGSCIIKTIYIDNWKTPSKDLVDSRYELTENTPTILSIPGGHVVSFKALQPHTKITVFSDCSLADSQKDDFRFPPDYWDFIN